MGGVGQWMRSVRWVNGWGGSMGEKVRWVNG